VITRCNSSGPLYTMRLPSHPPSSPASAPSALVASTSTWHRCLGHPGVDVLSKLSHESNVVCSRCTHDICRGCQLDCHIRLPFVSSNFRADNNFDLIHCDLWTYPVVSVSGYKYYLVILDDHSHFVWTFPLRVKSDTFSTLSHFFAYVSTQFGRTIKAVQCDNGREFDNATSRAFFAIKGVLLRMSYPYTSPQNGKAECMLYYRFMGPGPPSA
jgi:transposase InsO family protein